jgi:hypothetical protein
MDRVKVGLGINIFSASLQNYIHHVISSRPSLGWGDDPLYI